MTVPHSLPESYIVKQQTEPSATHPAMLNTSNTSRAHPPVSQFHIIKQLAANVWLCLPRGLATTPAIPQKRTLGDMLGGKSSMKLKKPDSKPGNEQILARLVVVKMCLDEEALNWQVIVRAHLKEKLRRSVAGDLNQELEALSLAPLFVPASLPGTTGPWLALTTPPLPAISLESILSKASSNTIPAAFIYKTFFSLLNALSSLHNLGILHNDLAASKVMVFFSPDSSTLAKDVHIRLLLSSASAISETVTADQSKADTKALIKMTYDLTRYHSYFRARRLFDTSSNPAINRGPPPIAMFADELKEKIAWPIRLQAARGYWNKWLSSMLGLPGQMIEEESADDDETLYRTAQTQGEKLPAWMTCLEMKLASEEEVLQATQGDGAVMT